jgi:hypothetical protein
LQKCTCIYHPSAALIVRITALRENKKIQV